MAYPVLNTAEILDNELSKFDQIIIYGCGEVGQRVCRWVQKKNGNILGFAVTKIDGQEKVLDETVYCIEDLQKYRESALVLVSTKENLHQEIQNVLDGYGFRNIEFIGNQLNEEIRVRMKIVKEKLSFQVHIVEHCNLNCRGCYHFSPLAKEEYLSIEEYAGDVQWLGALFHGEMEEIMILGGEPLLHPSISEFLRVTRKYFSVGRIKILSNGILLSQMPDAFWQACVDTDTEIWLTKYSIDINYDELEKLAEGHGKKITYFCYEPVRTLGHQPLDISGKRDFRKNFEICYRANSCVLLDHGKMYTCLIAAESKHFSKYFNIPLTVTEDDYIDIYELKTGRELLERLISPTPFCRYCNRDDVDVVGRIPWQRTKYQMEEWTE